MKKSFLLSLLLPFLFFSYSFAGEVTLAWDANYIYICVDTDTWKRAQIATWE